MNVIYCTIFTEVVSAFILDVPCLAGCSTISVLVRYPLQVRRIDYCLRYLAEALRRAGQDPGLALELTLIRVDVVWKETRV